MHVDGDPEHPITAGFLCGKVSNYLDRVYADDRLLHPLVRDGAKGEGRFRQVTLGRGARPRGARAARVRDEPRRRGDPALQLHRHAGADPGQHDERPRDARARRQRRSSARSAPPPAWWARSPRTASRPRSIPRSGPTRATCSSGAGTRCRPRRTCGASCSTRAAPGAQLVVVDPFRSRTARVADEHLRPLPGTDAALALGMMRAIVDAGLAGRGLVPRPRRRLRRAARARWRSTRSSAARRSAACDAETIARVGREFATTQPALLRLGVGAQRHLGAPAAYSTIACLPALTGAWRHRGGGCSYIPTATAAAVSSQRRSSATTCGRARCARSTCPSSATRSPIPRSTRRSRRSCAGTRTRPRSPPTRSACSRGSGARTCSRSCSSSS